jgi:hypothetical protein
MRRGVLLRFLRGTEARVQFDELSHPVSLDERFLESDALENAPCSPAVRSLK